MVVEEVEIVVGDVWMWFVIGNRLDCQFGDVLNPYILRLLGFGELFKDTGILVECCYDDHWKL